MLRHTFVHLPHVGPTTEQQLWNAGVTTWEEFLHSDALPARIEKQRPGLSTSLLTSLARLERGDAAFFDSCLPRGEQWRVYADFRHSAAFLDIETTGLSPARSYITMVGVLDIEGYTAYIKGENLEDLRGALERYDLIVTYNGAAFDLPYIEYHFGRMFNQVAHIDLRYPLRRLGHKGGLKSIEAQLGLDRPSGLSDLDGFDAVLLWHMWQEGDAGARDTLVRYNAEDVVSLPALADIAYNGLAASLPAPCPAISPFPRRTVDLPYDLGVVQRLRQFRRLAHFFEAGAG